MKLATVEFFAMKFKCEARTAGKKHRQQIHEINELSTLDKRCVYGA